MAQTGLDLREYNRDQTGILRLQCPRPAELDYIFLLGDGNEVMGENELFDLI